MKRLFLLAPLALTACDQLSPENALIERAQDAVSRDEPDPLAAQFRDVVVTSEGFVCGEVNNKSVAGAYTGFKPFAFREFSNGKNAWGLGKLDGCLFPRELVASCSGRSLSSTGCSNDGRDLLVQDGYPQSELVPVDPEFMNEGRVEVSPERELFPQLVPTLAATVTSGDTESDIKRLIAAAVDADSRCRGGPNDGPVDACDLRTELDDELNDRGYCLGKIDEPNALWRWHKCQPDSNGYGM